MIDDVAETEMALQVALQCDAVAHMADALVKLYRAKADLVRLVPHLAPVSMMGQESASLMEALGDVLNNMDAVDEGEDAWMTPVFQTAHQMFPATSS